MAVQFTGPGAYPPLEHLALLLARRGWRVEVRGYRIRGAYDFGFAEHPMIGVEMLPSAGTGWRLAVRYTEYVAWVAREAHQIKPDWIWASDSMGAFPGLMAAAACNAELVYQEHDVPAEGQPGVFRTAIGAFRRAAAKRAKFCVVPGSARARLLSDANALTEEPLVVWNCPRRDEVSSPRKARQRERPLAIYYHGSLSRELLPDSLMGAVGLLRGSVHLVIRGYDTSEGGEDLRRIEKSVEMNGVREWVRVEPPVSRGSLWHLVDSCDVGLALVPTLPANLNLQTLAGPSNKVFDYMARGMGLLVTDRPEWRALLASCDCARFCIPEKVESIAEHLDWFFQHPLETWEMGECGRRHVLTDWNFESVSAPVLKRLTADG